MEPSPPSPEGPEPDGGEGFDFQAAWRREREARLRAEESLAQLRAEASAREDGEPTVLVLDALRTGTWLWDMATGRVRRDARLLALLGLEPGEAEQDGTDWLRRVHPEDREVVRTTLHRALREGGYALDYRIVRPDGGVRWVRDRGAVLPDAHGAPRFVTGMATDVTGEARDPEERERFFRLAPDMFCVAGLDGYFHRVNPAFVHTLGWSEEELLGQPFFALVHPEDLEATHAELARLARGEPTLRFENRYRHREGDYKWLAWAASPIPSRGILYASARDITENKRLAEQARLRADFEQKLIGIVSHDLRLPLSVIHLSATHLLHHGPLTSEAREILGHIVAGTLRCTRLVHDLLDFTRARLGAGIPLVRQSVDLEALVRQGMEELAASAPARVVHLSTEGVPQGPWDPDRLAQVVGNLLSNAARYSPADTPIALRLRADAAWVTLEVHNQGAPIPAGLQARLFEPMQRGAPGTDTASRSVGLGLYIVQHLVEAHGGSVSVRSAEGEGTCFTVRLPRAPPSEPSAR